MMWKTNGITPFKFFTSSLLLTLKRYGLATKLIDTCTVKQVDKKGKEHT